MRRTSVKKLRGGRRYYAKLKERSATFAVDLEASQWYDLWHKHFDWYGYGRRDRRARQAHRTALFTAFSRILVQVAQIDRPVQVFVSIAPDRTPEDDALYLHTPNPNGTPYPHSFDGVDWKIRPPAFLSRFTKGEPWELGALKKDGATWWIVRARSQ